MLSKFREFEAITISHFNLKIANFFCDNDAEYVNNKFRSFCEEKGICTLNSIPYCFERNGIAERLN